MGTLERFVEPILLERRRRELAERVPDYLRVPFSKAAAPAAAAFLCEESDIVL